MHTRKRRFLIFLLSLQITLIPLSVFSEEESKSLLSPKSIFSEYFAAEVDTVAFVTYASSLLKEKLTISEFQNGIRNIGLEGILYRVEEEGKFIQAIRFKSPDGRWFRIGKQPLGRSDSELGFFIPSRTQQIEGLWLESFERTLSVDILIPGIAFGTVVKIEGLEDFRAHAPKEISGVDEASERQKFEQMKIKVLDQYDQKIKREKEESKRKIAETERMMAELDLIPKAEALISSTVNAREAVMRVISESLKSFYKQYSKATSDDQRYIAQNAIVTIQAPGQAMIDILDGVDHMALLDEKIARLEKNGQKAILVGTILTSHFDLPHRSAIAGIVTDEEQADHIIIKAAGVVFAKNSGQIPSLESALKEADTVALELNSSYGNRQSDITLEPELSHRNRVLHKTVERKKYQQAVSTLKSKTRDERPVQLHLNMLVEDEFPWGKGEFPHIGLVRSDFTYIDEKLEKEPSLEDLIERYKKFFGRASKAGVEEMNFRTFDYDANDKKPPYFESVNKENREGIDFSLNNPKGLKAFETQVEAIFRGLASTLDKGSPIQLNLLFPKVRRLDEFQRAADIVDRIYQQLRTENAVFDRIKFKLGIMVETKEALDNIQSFIGEVDFINVGTNDLTLSLFPDQVSRAKDPPKGKVKVEEYNHRVLGALVEIVKAASSPRNVQRRPPICVCGNLASYPECGLFLLGLEYPGLSLSMSYEKVLDLKANIAAHDYDEIQEYTKDVLDWIHQAQKLRGNEAKEAYSNLRNFLNEQGSKMKQNTQEYLSYEWANMTLSLDRLIEILGSVNDSLEKMIKDVNVSDVYQHRREIAWTLREQGILTENLFNKLVEHDWDLEEVLGILEVWAYRQLIDQGTFYVYRARKVGDDYWVRVLPTGEEFRWNSRYDRRIVKRPDGSVWIKAGPDQMFEAKRVTLQNEPNAEIYSYEENGETFYARSLSVRGAPYTYIKAKEEKEYAINLFKRGKSTHARQEKLYRDESGKVQIVHVPDWMKHPILQDVPYNTNKLNRSVLMFLLNDDLSSGEITWGHNMARPGYGHLFEDNSRILEILVRQLQLVDKTVRGGREKIGLIKGLLEANRLLQAERNRNRDLENLLKQMRVSPEIIQNPALFDQAA